MRKVLHRVFLAINILFAVSLLIAYLSVHINPEDFALPAFFGLAYPYLLLINIIITVIWAVNRRFEAFISVIIIAIGFTNFSNYIKLRKPRIDKTGTFKVMSYNIRLFNHFEYQNDTDTEKKVMSFIKAQQPNILCFQELYVNGNTSQKDEEFRKAFGGRYFSHVKLIGRGKNKFYGIATYTRFPIINRGEINYPGSSSLSIYTDILIQNDTFRIFNIHLQSFRLKKMERSFIDEIIDPEAKQTMNEIKSLSVSLKNGFARRALQSQILKDYAERSPYPVIIIGDFNDTPVSYSYRKICSNLNDSFVKSGYGAGFTYRGNYPPNRIDYILYDKNLVSTNFEIIKVKYSDHYPIMAYFKKTD